MAISPREMLLEPWLGVVHDPSVPRLSCARSIVLLSGLALLAACGEQGESGAPPSTLDTGHPPRTGPPSHVAGSFSIAIPAVTLAPGEEQTPCYLFPLEVEGPSRIIGGGSLEVGPGMHHGNVTTRPKTGEGIRACPEGTGAGADGEGIDILHGGAVLFGSSTQIAGTEWQSFPDGMGYRVKEGSEVVARMHYLNTSPEPLTVAPVYTWYTIDEASMKTELGPFAWIFTGFTIEPLSAKTVTGDCLFPEPMHLVNLLPHMHKLGTAFTGAYLGGPKDGEKFLDSEGYDPEGGVMVQYDQGVDLSQGDGASFSCTWKNNLDKTIGEGIGDNEMCILFGYAYPPEHAYSATAVEGGCIYLAPPAAE